MMAARWMILIAAATLCAPVLAGAQPTREDAEKDPLLKAMLAEMDRSMAQLRLKEFEKPFFIEYRVDDVEDLQIKAAYGAVLASEHGHQHVARVLVRVGDYKIDSSGARGEGSLQLAALDDDPVAVRSALWSATDSAYKAALAAYAQKQAALKQVQTQPQADDFSKEKPVIVLEPRMLLNVDAGAWADRVALHSGLYRNKDANKAGLADVYYSNCNFHARVTNTYLVNSEGTAVRKAASIYGENLGVGTQAGDGMHLDRSYGTTGVSLADLDSAEDFSKHVLALIASLTDLRKAPLVEEEYHGPVLFTADAATDVMEGLLARGVAATRPKLGTEARTNGPFANSYRARVLPELFEVIDDPSLRSFNGRGLVGSYSVDDQGVPAQAVKLIDGGKLENYLIGREPVRDFPQSNGHGRAAIARGAQPTAGVLQIKTREGLTDDALRQKLLDLGKERGLKSVYLVETMGPSLTPRLLYRMTADGKLELVRGAALDDLDQRALRTGVMAAGKELWMTNYSGDIPQTVMAPALLMEEVTVRRANEENEKLPFYPPPD